MAKLKKIKKKTHKTFSKKVIVRGNGSIKVGKGGHRHKTGNKSANINRRNKGTKTISNADLKRLKDIL